MGIIAYKHKNLIKIGFFGSLCHKGATIKLKVGMEEHSMGSLSHANLGLGWMSMTILPFCSGSATLMVSGYKLYAFVFLNGSLLRAFHTSLYYSLRHP